MIKWPEPAAHLADSLPLFTEAQLKQAVRDALEEAAKLVAPKTPRPCACESCDCGNQDDAQRVAEWDAENAAASAIRALIKEIPHD